MKDAIAVRFLGGAFVPLSPVIHKKFEEGKLYYVAVKEERYWPRHQWFFCLIRDVWNSLDDQQKEEFPTEEILRKRMLIAAGFKTTSSFVCKGDSEFQSQLRVLTAASNDNTFISVKDLGDDYKVIVVTVAESQRMNKMKEDRFKESVSAVQEELRKLIGCTRDDIRAHISEIRGKKRRKESV